MIAAAGDLKKKIRSAEVQRFVEYVKNTPNVYVFANKETWKSNPELKEFFEKISTVKENSCMQFGSIIAVKFQAVLNKNNYGVFPKYKYAIPEDLAIRYRVNYK